MAAVPPGEATTPRLKSHFSSYDDDAADRKPKRSTVGAWWSESMRHPGRGMARDVRNRLAVYKSDFTDGWDWRITPGVLRTYFFNLITLLAFSMRMYTTTDNYYGVNEAIMSSAMAALVFGLFSAQPLTLVGAGGIISIFQSTMYSMLVLCDSREIFPQFMAWTGIWAALFLWAFAVFNVCDVMRYATEFLSESFGLYLAAMYFSQALKELVRDNEDIGHPDLDSVTMMLAAMYLFFIYLSETIASSPYRGVKIRTFLTNYSFMGITILWIIFSNIWPAALKVDLERLPVLKPFELTLNRAWVVDFWSLDFDYTYYTLPCGFLMSIFLFLDHNISSLNAQSRQYPLKKPGGLHWDLYLLGLTTFIASVLGLPVPGGLNPHATMHTDCLTEGRSVMCVGQPSKDGNSVKMVEKLIASYVLEQRVTHIFVGLLMLLTVGTPAVYLLQYIPHAILGGVFFVLSLGLLESNSIVEKLGFLQMDTHWVTYLHNNAHVSPQRILSWALVQLLYTSFILVTSRSHALIFAPLFFAAIISPIRVRLMPMLFGQQAVNALDGFLATNPCLLESLGGRAAMSINEAEEARDSMCHWPDRRHGVTRQRIPPADATHSLEL